jgi:hypothetical protein
MRQFRPDIQSGCRAYFYALLLHDVANLLENLQNHL